MTRWVRLETATRARRGSWTGFVAGLALFAAPGLGPKFPPTDRPSEVVLRVQDDPHRHVFLRYAQVGNYSVKEEDLPPPVETSPPAYLPSGSEPQTSTPPGSAPTSAENEGASSAPEGSGENRAGSEPPRPVAESPEGRFSTTPAAEFSSGSRQLSNRPLTQLVEHAPTGARAASLRQVEAARVLLLAGKPNSAIRKLETAVSIDASNPYAYFYLGRAYFAKGNYPQARTFFDRASIGFTRNPEWLGETYAFEGLIDELTGKRGAAEENYRQALAVAPANFMALVGYGRVKSGEEPADTNPPSSALGEGGPFSDTAVPSRRSPAPATQP